ncbi:cupin [Halorubellus sp. PRR65]|uniref:cupin domain-containing protein n=1 Tax=Halorubellus sp. PRR65 TaxID=3098148 RepID=UPI002B2569FD|nr:cupin [Halorubellus sp. PRR65]
MERTGVDAEGATGGTGVGDALGTTDLAVVRYRLAPGEGFPSGLHAHLDQEEVFVVLAGEAVFEVLPPAADWPESSAESPGDAESPSGARPRGREVTVAASEAVRFAPGEFQTGRNPASADRDLVALALGAPKETDDVRIPARCPGCGAPALRLGTGGDAFTLDCSECESSFDPGPCPDCGSPDLAMGLDADRHPVSRCADCESEHETAPLVH